MLNQQYPHHHAQVVPVSPPHYSDPSHFRQHQQQQQQKQHQLHQHQHQHQQSYDFSSYHRHSSLVSQPQSQSQSQFAATPLTPCPSNSQSLSHPPSFSYSSSTPPPSASPNYSSPAFSADNSPCEDDFSAVALFDPSDFSMQEQRNSFGLLSDTPPIKVYPSLLGEGEDGLGNQDVDPSFLLLNSGPTLTNFEYNNNSSNSNNSNGNLLNPSTKGATQNRQSYQHHRKSSSASSAQVPSLDSSGSSPSFGGYQPNSTQYPSTPAPSRPLPTPEHTPVQGSFLAAPFDSYETGSGDAHDSGVEMAMRRAMLDQQRQQRQPQQQQDNSPFPYSLAPSSVSTLNSNSPTTPQTTHGDEFDGGSRGISHADYSSNNTTQMAMPKLNRTISDVYQDELYNPAMSAMPQSQPVQAPQQANNNNKPYPYQSMINERLQAAHQGHMAAAQQAQTGDNRQGSPFRRGSPYAQPASAYHSAHLQQPSQLSSDLPQSGLRGMAMMSEGQGEPKTISPKEALLEYHEPSEDANIPLFPSQAEAPQYQISPPTMAPSSGLQAAQNYMGMDQFNNNHFGRSSQQHQQYYLRQQSLQQQLQNQGIQQQQQQLPQPKQPQQQQQKQMPPQQQQMPVSQPQSQQLNNRNRLVHQTPEFPPPLPSMEESTNGATNTPDDAPSTSQRVNEVTSSPEVIRRPETTSSDAGTYSCTYHGCAQRFETPAKLQKHKREAHRQTTPSSHGLVREGSAGALARNTQAGPHRCERTNPATGKPCNSIFSRPYDLTRHEDTIHNARKQKVRCHLCTEEKTFSRNDALTRHMRVVHPEVNWPGKQKRKGRD